jgi:PAP2 superfamily
VAGHDEPVHTVGMTWQQAWVTSVVLVVVGAVLATAPNKRLRWLGAFAREAAVIGILYGLWQVAGKISVTGRSGAFGRAQWIQRFEHDVWLPSEASVQRVFLPHHQLIQGANLYYASMHLTMMLVFLIWLFVRHRDDYRPVRQVMAWTTLGCLLIQLLPVAPPRMFPGIEDTAMTYGQSVYANGLPFDQLSAMPSVHVGWAVLVGWYVWKVSPSKWRFLGPLHSVLTILVVVVTGNHWWLDGIVAVLVLSVSAWGVYGVRLAWRTVRDRRRTAASPPLAQTAGLPG